MTNEEKELLLKVLCEMLPYGVKISTRIKGNSNFRDSELSGELLDDFAKKDWGIIKPYLRLMSSMTEEEKELSWWYQRDAKCDNFILYMSRYVEWLDSKHFDWRTDGNGKTMIEKGLALEAPEGMYNN